MNVTGKYEVQLVDINTGEVVYSHTQKNLITDYGYYWLNYVQLPTHITLAEETTPIDSGVDYRRYQTFAEMGFTKIESSYDTGSASVSRADSDTTVHVSFKFPAPAADREIDIIATGRNSDTNYIMSFIKLTNPIQQLTTTILYVRYTVQAAYVGNSNSNGAVVNPWVNAKVQSEGDLLDPYSTYGSYRGLGSEAIVMATPYHIDDPSKCARVARYNDTIDNISIYQNYIRSLGGRDESVFGTMATVSMSTSQYQGMYASVIHEYHRAMISANPSVSNPQVKDVIQHGIGDTYRFVNTSIAPTGYGTLAATGTPTITSLSKYVDFEITHSGDASDIYQDTVTFDSSTNTFTPVTSAITDWDNSSNGSIVRVSFSGTLPAELTEGTIYYLIYSPTALKLSTSESGSEIELSDDGSGTITVTRESTALMTVSTDSVLYPKNHSTVMQPANNTNGDIIFSYYDDYNCFVPWSTKVGDYLYYASVQADDPSLKGNDLYNAGGSSDLAICKWKFGSYETGETIAAAASMSSTFVKDGSDIFVNSNDGIVVIDTSDDSVYGPYTISGVSNYTTLKMDEASGNVVCFHRDQGFSVFEPSAFKASGAVLDTVLFSEVSVLNALSSEYKQMYVTADVYDNVLAWSDLYDTEYIIFHWDGIGNRTGTVRTNTVSRQSTIAPLIYRDGSKNVAVVEINSQYSYYYTKVHDEIWDGSSYSTTTYDIGSAYLGEIRPFMDEFGIVHIYHYQQHSTFDINTKEITSETMPYEDSQSMNCNNFSWSYHPVPPGELTTIDDTPVLLAGYNVYKWDEVSITGGTIDFTKEKSTVPVPKTAYTSLVNSVDFAFDNTAGIASENQFVAGERYTVLLSPFDLKTNMDEASLKINYFATETRKFTDVEYGVASDTITITEASERDFRKMLFVTVSIDGVEVSDYTYDSSTGVITFNDGSYGEQFVLVSYTVVYRR